MNRTRLLTRGVGSFVDPPKRWPVFSFKIRLQFPLGFLSPLPPRNWSSTTACMVSGSRTRTRVPVLIVVVVAL